MWTDDISRALHPHPLLSAASVGGRRALPSAAEQGCVAPIASLDRDLRVHVAFKMLAEAVAGKGRRRAWPVLSLLES